MFNSSLMNKLIRIEGVSERHSTASLRSWMLRNIHEQKWCKASGPRKKREANQMIKSKADTNRAWQQSKELTKQQNITQRLNDLNDRSDLSNAPLTVRAIDISVYMVS